MTVNQLVQRQHEQNEETEFYPTTVEIVDAVAKYLSAIDGETIHSIIDIGCGNGSFFEKLDNTNYFYENEYHNVNYHSKLVKNYQKFGIEKSNILAEQLPEDVILLGSDFYSNTLIDKKVDVIFCNPPYSDFENWAEKIIKQGNARYIILVIPCRWKNSEKIKFALEQRKLETEVIGTYDFSDAERKARATVDVIVIAPAKISYNGRYYKDDGTDPFDIWFDETFKFNAEKSIDKSEYKAEETKKQELIAKGDTAEMLVQFYNDDMEKLYNNYRALERLDPEIFKELKVDVAMLKTSLKTRLQGLKHLYWDLLFKKYDRITCRLTTTGRRKVINKLNDNTAIDFTMENIFQITMWLIKHSNTLFDSQLSDFFYSLCNTENIHRYKSNLRWNDDDWKYLKDSVFEYGYTHKERLSKLVNIKLDYRIIVTAYKNFDFDWSKVRLSESCIDFLYDLSVIAENLGFKVDMQLPKDKWQDIEYDTWTNRDIYTTDGKLFCNLKLYKNGNRHIKFCKEFMQKLNIEMARINGWIQNKEQAVDELEISKEDVEKMWNKNMQIGAIESRQLLGLPEVV